MIDLRFNRLLLFALRQTFDQRGFSGNLKLFDKGVQYNRVLVQLHQLAGPWIAVPLPNQAMLRRVISPESDWSGV
jgi:hypothetical protein